MGGKRLKLVVLEVPGTGRGATGVATGRGATGVSMSSGTTGAAVLVEFPCKKTWRAVYICP